jgi:hypothetical protein
MLDVIELADADGRRASVSPGVVEFINAPGRAYDYRITIDVETTLVRREAGPGQAVIAVDSDRHAHAYATEVATIRRQGGEPFSVRKMKDERVGELVRQAVGELTTHADGRHGMAEASAREMLRGEQKKRAAAPSAMTVVVEADRRAAETGEPVWEVTRRALESAHEAHSLATVKKLRARAMAEGLIPTRRPGRPRHGT